MRQTRQRKAQRMGSTSLLVAAIGLGLGFGSTVRADLIGEWLFDNNLLETSGFTAAGTHDGEAIGSVTYTTDTPLDSGGYAVNLTGGDNAVRVLNSNEKIGGSQNLGDNLTYQSTYDADISSNPMAISVWAKGWPDSNWEPFVSKKGESGNGYQLRKYDNTSHAAFTLRGTGAIDDPQGEISNTNDGQWHHYVGVWDPANSNRYLYVDGVLDVAGSITDGSDTGSVSVASYEYLVFGARDNGGSINSYSHVQLDDVRMYNSVLTQADIATVADRNMTASEKIADSLSGAGLAEGIRYHRVTSGSGGLSNIDQGEGLLSGELYNPNGGSAGSASLINYTSNATEGLIPGTDNFPGGATDNSATQWAGVMDIQTAGQYTFGVNSDDGFRLTIGGKLVAEYYGGTGGSDQRVSISFDEAGLYRFELNHYNGTGGNHLEFWATEGSDSSLGVGPLVGDTANGGIAVYQNVLAPGQNLGAALAQDAGTQVVSVENVQRTDTAVNSLHQVTEMLDGNIVPNNHTFHARTNITGVGTPSGFAGDNFGAVFTGVMNITEAGQYTFTTTSDDGFRLVIGGTVVSEANYNKGTTPAITNTANFLEAGVYEYELYWFERGGGEGMTLSAVQDSTGDDVNLYGLVGDQDTLHRAYTGFVVTGVKLAAGQLGGSLGDTNEAMTLIENSSLYGSATAREFYDTINLLDGGPDQHYGSSDAPPITGDNYATLARASVYFDAAGYWTFGVNGDDGFALALGGNVVLERFGTGSPGDVLSTVFVKEAGWYDLAMLMFEAGSGSTFELFAAQGAFTAYNSTDFHLVGDTANGGLLVMTVPAPAALPAGLALLAIAGLRRRRR